MKMDELLTSVNKATKDATTECDRLRSTLEDTTVQLARTRTEAEHLKARNSELEAQLAKAQSQLEKSQLGEHKSKEDISVILFKAKLQRSSYSFNFLTSLPKIMFTNMFTRFIQHKSTYFSRMIVYGKDEAKNEVAKLLKCQTDMEQLHAQQIEELRKHYTEARTKVGLFELELDKLFQERCYLTAKLSDAEHKASRLRVVFDFSYI
ncbi:hypothetical protein PHET_07509 [Paragonimus heterotremus]|uniref:Uncharacterized protein n=1 Tax=Paragonimus heterotremus TaxID=100268 RepID=A0A8J4TDA5_9TREM|nr:hypothetical protein PHET_07509 [Paragonimus heterotremus]